MKSGYGYCLRPYGPAYRSAILTTRTRFLETEGDAPVSGNHSGEGIQGYLV